MHLLRVLDPSEIQHESEVFDASLLEGLSNIVGCSISREAWAQAGLPIRHAGLGISYCVSVAPSAFLSSYLTFMSRLPGLGLPFQNFRPSQSFVNASLSVNSQTANSIAETRNWSSPL